jgi:hypothetical protein
MKNEHLTDDVIQASVWDEDILDLSSKTHMEICAQCQAKAAGYRALFVKVEQLARPKFDFNLSATVLGQLDFQKEMEPASSTPSDSQMFARTNAAPVSQARRAPKAISRSFVLYLLFAGLLIGLPVYLFQEYFENIINGVSALQAYLIIVSIVLISGILIFDEYRKFNTRLNALDM